jgi:hypothetical protein
MGAVVIKAVLGSVAAMTAVWGFGQAVAAPAKPADMAVWVVSPADDSCRTEIDLVSRSGATVPVLLTSDGDTVELRFYKDEMPAHGFLPIRIDQKPFSNLMMRREDPKAGSMVLSNDTLAAMRKGQTLQIAWLSDELLSAPLAGSDQGIVDLRTCGAQVAQQFKAVQASQAASRAQADADHRAKQLADEQLAVVRAQRAEAEARANAERATAEKTELETRMIQQRAAEEQARVQAAADAQRRAQEDSGYYYPPRPPPPSYYRYYPPN